MQKVEKEKRHFTSVSIPSLLFSKVKKRIEDTGFTSVSSFVTFLLREVVSWSPEEKGIRKKDEENIKNKLKKLGYL